MSSCDESWGEILNTTLAAPGWTVDIIQQEAFACDEHCTPEEDDPCPSSGVHTQMSREAGIPVVLWATVRRNYRDTVRTGTEVSPVIFKDASLICTDEYRWMYTDRTTVRGKNGQAKPTRVVSIRVVPPADA